MKVEDTYFFLKVFENHKEGNVSKILTQFLIGCTWSLLLLACEQIVRFRKFLHWLTSFC